MIDRLKEEIKTSFPHIEFDSDNEMKDWFFDRFLPLLILNWMGGVETHEDGRGSFDWRDFDLMRETIHDWYCGNSPPHPQKLMS